VTNQRRLAGLCLVALIEEEAEVGVSSSGGDLRPAAVQGLDGWTGAIQGDIGVGEGVQDTIGEGAISFV